MLEIILLTCRETIFNVLSHDEIPTYDEICYANVAGKQTQIVYKKRFATNKYTKVKESQTLLEKFCY